MNKLKGEKENKKGNKLQQLGRSIVRGFVGIMGGGFLVRQQVLRHIPFLLFLTVLGFVYIANSYYAEKNIREINHMKNELKELRSEYITTKSDLMFKSNQSQVAKEVAEMGIKESVVPPKKIIVEPEELKVE